MKTQSFFREDDLGELREKSLKDPYTPEEGMGDLSGEFTKTLLGRYKMAAHLFSHLFLFIHHIAILSADSSGSAQDQEGLLDLQKVWLDLGHALTAAQHAFEMHNEISSVICDVIPDDMTIVVMGQGARYVQ